MYSSEEYEIGMDIGSFENGVFMLPNGCAPCYAAEKAFVEGWEDAGGILENKDWMCSDGRILKGDPLYNGCCWSEPGDVRESVAVEARFRPEIEKALGTAIEEGSESAVVALYYLLGQAAWRDDPVLQADVDQIVREQLDLEDMLREKDKEAEQEEDWQGQGPRFC